MMNLERMIKVKNKKIINSFKYALRGLLFAFKTERNMKIHILIMLMVIIAGAILKISLWEWIVCVFLFGAVISSELINTAIETVLDMVMPYKNDKAKIAKDIAASAVLVVAITSAIIGALIFVPHIILWLQ